MIYITGDTHGSYDLDKLRTKNFPEQKNMTKDDYIIILGDFGLVWNDSKAEKKWREWLDNKKFTTLFIDGNHDNHELIWSYPDVEMFGNKVHAISDSIFYLKRGEIYTIDGHTFLTLGGAESYDWMYRTLGVDMWLTESIMKSDLQKAIDNISHYNFHVDAVLSHDAPYSIIRRFVKPFAEPTKSSLLLKDLWHQIDFDAWYCGHWHIDEEYSDENNRQFFFLYNSFKKF